MTQQVLPLVMFLAAGFGLSGSALAGASKTENANPDQKCLIAEVNPVTGNVHCIKPLGAPVDPPPTGEAPCRRDPHTKGQWTWGPNCKP